MRELLSRACGARDQAACNAMLDRGWARLGGKPAEAVAGAQDGGAAAPKPQKTE